MSELILNDLSRWPLVGALAGVDEAGRGALAGPLFVACAASFNLNSLPSWTEEVRDSKKLKASRRAELSRELLHLDGLSISICSTSAKVIDKWNVLRGTMMAMSRSIRINRLTIGKILIDGQQIPTTVVGDVEAIVGGDDKSFLIAAASVVAKQSRDEYMRKLHRRWPSYGFDRHKGYGTAEHFSAIWKHGPCPEHRLSFYPLNDPNFSRCPSLE